MPKLFISYRRDDSPYPAHSICERLRSHFGKDSIFIDVDTIPFGVDFRKHLNDAVGNCDILLAIIGLKWLNSEQSDGSRRLDDPRDFVRIEIEAALRRNVPVIPILVDHVEMPNIEQLPEALSELAFRHATQVRPGPDFSSDLDRLVWGLERLLQLDSGQASTPSPAGSPQSTIVDSQSFVEAKAGEIRKLQLEEIEIPICWCPSGGFRELEGVVHEHAPKQLRLQIDSRGWPCAPNLPGYPG